MANVLLIEDEADSADVVMRFLTRIGHHVTIAPDGTQALTKLIDERPDVVVLDVRLPEMDGINLLEVMRSYLRWHEMPVILLSAHATPAQLTSARNLGVNDILHKAHFELTDLAAAIDRSTGLHSGA